MDLLGCAGPLRPTKFLPRLGPPRGRPSFCSDLTTWPVTFAATDREGSQALQNDSGLASGHSRLALLPFMPAVSASLQGRNTHAPTAVPHAPRRRRGGILGFLAAGGARAAAGDAGDRIPRQ